jgi:amino acid transporter
VTVLAAIDVGTYQFTLGAAGALLGFDPAKVSIAWQAAAVVGIAGSQALVNHLGIRLTTRLTDFSGYWILAVAVALTAAMLFFAPHLAPRELVAFSNLSGARGGNVWPETASVPWLFLLGFLLPAYTVTGFDASAHTAEETIGAGLNVPRGIVRSVVVSGLFGWGMLAAIVIAVPSPAEAAAQGPNAFFFIVGAVLPPRLAAVLYAGIALAQYLCGLATVTSASRMAYAFARDGGLPFSRVLRQVSARQAPAAAVWATTALAIAFTLYTPVYSTITAVCTIFLYLSYVVPIALGLRAWGRTWTAMGPWGVGRWFRPIALAAVLFCGLLIVIGVQPPNEAALWIVAGAVVALLAGWLAHARRRFTGPPVVAPSPVTPSP